MFLACAKRRCTCYTTVYRRQNTKQLAKHFQCAFYYRIIVVYIYHNNVCYQLNSSAALSL